MRHMGAIILLGISQQKQTKIHVTMTSIYSDLCNVMFELSITKILSISFVQKRCNSCTLVIDQINKSHDALVSYPMMHHSCNWPKLQIPWCTCPISHNAPFRTKICTFLFWMVHCGIPDKCIMGFVRLVYCSNPLLFILQYLHHAKPDIS